MEFVMQFALGRDALPLCMEALPCQWRLESLPLLSIHQHCFVCAVTRLFTLLQSTVLVLKWQRPPGPGAEVAYGVAEGRAVAEAGLWASPGICSNHYRLLHCGTGIWASSAQSRDTNTGVWAPFMCPDALADP